MRQVMTPPDIAKLLHLLHEMAVRLAPCLVEANEAMLHADLLVEPYRRAVGVADVPVGVDGHVLDPWHHANTALLAGGGDLIGVVAALCALLEGFLGRRWVLLLHHLLVAGEVRAALGDVPGTLAHRQAATDLLLERVEVVVILVGDDDALGV